MKKETRDRFVSELFNAQSNPKLDRWCDSINRNWCPGTSMHDAEQFDEIRQQSTRLSEFRRERRLWPTHSPKDPKDGGHHPMEAVVHYIVRRIRVSSNTSA